MKKDIFLCILFILTGCMLIACGDSGGGGSSSSSIDKALIGQWEGYVPMSTGKADIDCPIIVTFNSDSTFVNIIVYPDDEDNPGAIIEGQKGTWEADGSNLTITPGEEWDEGDEGIAPDWVEDEGAETMEMTYTISNGGTLLTANTENGTMIFEKGTPPAPDARLTGSWSFTEIIDYDEDGDDETIRNTLTLSSGGSFSMDKTDDTTSQLLEKESGTYGAYRSVEGIRYLVAVSTSKHEDGEELTGYYFKRMRFELNMFGAPDTLLLFTDEEAEFERDGDDPGIPAPDTSITGYWMGEETHDSTTLGSLILFRNDNLFEKILFYQSGDSKPGDMAGGNKGKYMANSGEMIVLVEEEWDDYSWEDMSDPELVDVGYNLSGSSINIITDEEGSSYMKITEPVLSTDYEGLWRGTTGDGEYQLDVSVDSSGNVLQDVYHSPDFTDPVESFSGTLSVLTIGTTDYFYIEFNYNELDSEEIYFIRLFPYVINPDESITMETSLGTIVFVKQT